MMVEGFVMLVVPILERKTARWLPGVVEAKKSEASEIHSPD
jgi:hypothetical protein